MLEIKNFSKTYTKGKKAVDNINLHIKPGEVFGFIGHNGAGKTTTIKSIVGILDFEEGEILIDGNSIKDDPIKCKSITAYIPDSPELYEQLTGIQYLNFICDIYKISTDRRKEDIEKYAKIFELAGRLGDLISSTLMG